MQRNDGPAVGAVATTFEILEAVRTLDAPGVSEIARHLDRSKSGVHKHLNTLTQLGYLTRSGDGYEVGLGVWALGTRVPDRFPMEQGEQTVDSLVASSGHSAALVFFEDGRAYYAVQNCTPDVRERIGGLGDRLPLHATAAGKAILAYLPSETRTGLLEALDLQAFTDETITDESVLREHLESVRKGRTAVEREERAEGVLSIAAPITEAPNAPIGALSVVGTADELDEDELDGRLRSLVVNASRSIENAISSD